VEDETVEIIGQLFATAIRLQQYKFPLWSHYWVITQVSLLKQVQ